MTDATVATEVRTADGWLEFQEYFVHRRQEPDVLEVRFAGVEPSPPTRRSSPPSSAPRRSSCARRTRWSPSGRSSRCPGCAARLDAARARGVPVAAVSPIVGGRALKGPADRMLVALGHESSAAGVARLYADLVDVFVLDAVDAAEAGAVEALGMQALVADTIMADDASRARLAGEVLAAVLP